MSKISSAIATCLFIVIFFGCSDWDLERTSFVEVFTVGASDIGANHATLVGDTENLRESRVIENGFVLSSTVSSLNGLQADKPSTRSALADIRDEGKSGQPFIVPVSDLDPSTTYFFRAFVRLQGEAEPVYGGIDSFSTISLDINITSAERLNMGCPVEIQVIIELETKGGQSDDLQYGIVWTHNLESRPTLEDNVLRGSVLDISSGPNVSISLDCNANYKMRAFLQLRNEQPVYSASVQFSTYPGGYWSLVGDLPQEWSRDVEPSPSVTSLCFEAFSSGPFGYIMGWDRQFIDYVFWQFDPSSTGWLKMPEIPIDFQCTNPMISSEDGRLIGFRPSAVLQFDVDKEMWTILGVPNHEARHAFYFENNQQVIHGLGSLFASGEYRTAVWRFSLTNVDQDVPLDDFPGIPRIGPTYFQIGDQGYVGLGKDVNREIRTDFWRLDLDHESWTSIAPIPEAMITRVGLASEGKGYVITGIDSNNNVSSSVWEYDPDVDQWNKLTDFGRGDGTADFGFVIEGVIYAGLGITRDGRHRQEFWRYIPEL